MHRTRIFATFILISLLASAATAQEREGTTPRELMFFYSPTCHNCAVAKQEVIPYLEQRFKGAIRIAFLNVEEMDNYTMLLGLQKQNKVTFTELTMPVFYFEGAFIIGPHRLKERLTDLISQGLRLPPVQRPQGTPGVDLVERFKNFSLFAVVGAGLLDGINPCAFTVIVFFISFLALQGYRRRELVCIGAAFIAAVFLTYIAIGIGLLGFFYHLTHMWVASRIFNVAMGVFTLALGCLAVNDLAVYLRTGRTEGLALQLPSAVKHQIHAIIGMHYRKGMPAPAGTIAPRHTLLRLLLSAFVTGILVSLLEAVCTGQVYLPTITFVLKSSQLKAQALLYLLLYNGMFVVPLIIIFVLALLGTTSQEFAGFLKKHLATVKVLMALFFFGLGAFLLWKG